jgi:hypothetical protein
MLIGAIAICDLLIHVDRLCFDRYKIDYTWFISQPHLQRAIFGR